MSDPSKAGSSADDGAATPEIAQIEAEIERTRADLAHTVDQLGAKVDQQKQQAGQAAKIAAGAAGAVVLLVVVVKLVRRRKS